MADKYTKGDVITTYEELLNQKKIYYKSVRIGKIIFWNWTYKFAVKSIRKGYCRKAVNK